MTQVPKESTELKGYNNSDISKMMPSQVKRWHRVDELSTV